MLGFADIGESGLADRIIHKNHTRKCINLLTSQITNI